MGCEELRKRLAGDPSRSRADFDRHAENCAACRAYRDRLLRAEALIRKAVRFDVNAIGSPIRSGWVTLSSAIAAGLVAGIAFWALLGRGADLTPEALADAVANHWYLEPDSWVATERAVSASLLGEVLAGEADVNLARLDTVSYAETCWVAGDWIPHLVVQGTAGPYMVLLMRGRSFETPIPVELPEEGLSGHIVPTGGGSIAVLGGGRLAELERIEAAVASAVNWSI